MSEPLYGLRVTARDVWGCLRPVLLLVVALLGYALARYWQMRTLAQMVAEELAR